MGLRSFEYLCHPVAQVLLPGQLHPAGQQGRTQPADSIASQSHARHLRAFSLAFSLRSAGNLVVIQVTVGHGRRIELEIAVLERLDGNIVEVTIRGICATSLTNSPRSW